jgi:hypothetical protein
MDENERKLFLFTLATVAIFLALVAGVGFALGLKP